MFAVVSKITGDGRKSRGVVLTVWMGEEARTQHAAYTPPASGCLGALVGLVLVGGALGYGFAA